MGQCLIWLIALVLECVRRHNLDTKGAKVAADTTLEIVSSYWSELTELERKLINLRNAAQGFKIRHLR